MNKEKKRKFISIIRWYHSQIFSFDKEQNYHMMPLEAMQELGYECEIFAIDSQVKIEDDPNFVPWVRVIYYKNIFQYLSYLWENRNALIYSNSLTIKTLLVGLIGKRTIFIPHDSIFGSNKIKELIIKFFYYFFDKIRVNNDWEVKKVNLIKKWLAVKIPLVVSDTFHSKHNKRTGNIFVSLWNLIPKKQPEFLLSALKVVKNKWYTFRLLVIGEDRLLNTYGYSYSNLVKKYGLENEINILGFQPHERLVKLLQWVSLYINTSRQEWLCLAVYECALMWVYPILPNILSFDRVFWAAGSYYEKSSVNSLAEKIIDFLENKELYKNKNILIQELIRKNYNYKIIKKKLVRLFTSFEI